MATIEIYPVAWSPVTLVCGLELLQSAIPQPFLLREFSRVAFLFSGLFPSSVWLGNVVICCCLLSGRVTRFSAGRLAKALLKFLYVDGEVSLSARVIADFAI